MSVFRNLLMSIKKQDEDIRLDYLQSDGNQYLLTGQKLNYNSKFDLLFEILPDTSRSEFFGFGDNRTSGSSTPNHFLLYDNRYGLYYLYNNSDWSRWSNAVSQPKPLKILLEARDNVAYFKNPDTMDTYYTKTSATRTGEDYDVPTMFAVRYYATQGQPYDIIYGVIKIYEYTIYDTNDTSVITHHYIPVLHNGIACMKDEITGDYYYNQGTGEFIYPIPPEPSPLPSEYQRVEYIQSSGTQYIDTGISGDAIGEYKIKMDTLSRVRQWEQYFGGQLYTENEIGKLYENQYNLVYQGYPFQRNQYVALEPVNGGIYEIEVSTENGIISNGVVKSSYTGAKWGTMTFYIFNSHSEPTLGASMKLYYLKMYSDGVLVRDYIPCYRISDDEIGLYDLVNNTFFTNDGTGTFIKGNDI